MRVECMGVVVVVGARRAVVQQPPWLSGNRSVLVLKIDKVRPRIAPIPRPYL